MTASFDLGNRKRPGIYFKLIWLPNNQVCRVSKQRIQLSVTFEVDHSGINYATDASAFTFKPRERATSQTRVRLAEA